VKYFRNSHRNILVMKHKQLMSTFRYLDMKRYRNVIETSLDIIS